LICPRCGENNPDNFKFCGMCGSNLLSASEGREKPAAKASTESNQAARSQSMAFSRMEPRGANSKPGTLTIDEPRPPRPPEPRITDSVEPIAGPSLLGLNQPTPETIRETTFRGMTTYYPEERHPAWGRILLTLIFIVGLVAIGWWRYKNYGAPGHGMPSWLSAMNKTTPPSDNQAPQYGTKPAGQSANQNADQSKNQANDQSKAATSGDNTASTNSAADSGNSADQPNAASDKSPDNKSADNKSADSPSAESAAKTDQPAASAPAKPTKAAKAAAAKADNEDSTPAAKPKPVAASSEGDGLFRKGEAYLYGRGVPESCSQAIRYLKSASDKTSSKARSTFGTMYATGHCVPRDLPTSYRWFAMALQADPNNSILEKDLSAIWNQMTPPERQLATKLKPNGE
jgi:zinc ribbon protein/Sel1 repeat-containing protein